MTTGKRYEITETTWPEKTFITKRAKLPFDELPAFFKESYGAIYGALARAGITTDAMPCAFYYTIDEGNKETDMAVAVPVPSNTPDVPGYEKTILPPCRLAMATHIGPYETMAPVYAALEGHIDGLHQKKQMVIEEYFSDPETEKDTAKWKTNIYFLLK